MRKIDRLVIAAIPIEIRRSSRRRSRIGLSFDPSGRLVMEAPLDATEADIRSIVERHQRWLKSRLKAAQASTELSGCLRYVTGERVHYRGAPYQLVIADGETDTVLLQVTRRRPSPQLQLDMGRACAGSLTVVLGPACGRTGPSGGAGAGGVQRSERVRLLLQAWYRVHADALFARQFEYFRSRLPWLHDRLPPWRHRFMRSQWGSCSQSGRIALNTHLVKLPHRLTRYVVLHELCHLRHHDHGPSFYALMSRYMPDWHRRRAELDRYLPVLLQE
ncbi:MAG: M48 family metallopeptidase [Pseudomonadales bacterium]